MRPIIEAVVDMGSFLEIDRLHGRSVITGLARLDRWPVAAIASDPFVLDGEIPDRGNHRPARHAPATL